MIIYLQCLIKEKYMVNEYMFDEIMRMKNANKNSVISSLDKMSKYCKDIKLLTNEKHEVFYRVDANIIRQLDIESNELLVLNQNGWVLSEDKKFLEYFI